MNFCNKPYLKSGNNNSWLKSLFTTKLLAVKLFIRENNMCTFESLSVSIDGQCVWFAQACWNTWVFDSSLCNFNIVRWILTFKERKRAKQRKQNSRTFYESVNLCKTHSRKKGSTPHLFYFVSTFLTIVLFWKFRHPTAKPFVYHNL